MIREQALLAIKQYDLEEPGKILQQVGNTRTVFRIEAGNERYALHEFNPYTTPAELQAQLRLIHCLQEAALQTIVPIHTSSGELFACVNERLWALFPWYEGKIGEIEDLQDLQALATVQGNWIASIERLRVHVDWPTIVEEAQQFRQRKEWAWVVPLDQVPLFAQEKQIGQYAQTHMPDSPHSKDLLALLPDLACHIDDFDELLCRYGVAEFSRTVTHGDFHPYNIYRTDRAVMVLDMECYGFEPRITDFARTANWFYKKHTPTEKADLLKRFQQQAQLTVAEIDILPLMMCAHDLYYAVLHLFLFLVQKKDLVEQQRLIGAIQWEMRAAERFQRERDTILRAYRQGH